MIRRTWEWCIGYGWPFLSIVLIVVAGHLFLLEETFCGCKERDLRLFGVFLQVLGFWTVILGLHDIGKQFGHTIFWKRIWRYLGPRLGFRRDSPLLSPMNLTASATIEKGRVRVGLAPNAPLEERVRVLEQAMNLLYPELDHLRSVDRALETKIGQSVKTEAEERRQEDARLHDKIRTTITGGIQLQWFGVWCFVFGIVFGTASPEIASASWLVAGHNEPSCNESVWEWLDSEQ